MGHFVRYPVALVAAAWDMLPRQHAFDRRTKGRETPFVRGEKKKVSMFHFADWIYSSRGRSEIRPQHLNCYWLCGCVEVT